MNSEGEIYLPHLYLVGLLLCASTKKMKADSLFNLLKRDYTTQIPKSEILMPEYI